MTSIDKGNWSTSLFVPQTEINFFPDLQSLNFLMEKCNFLNVVLPIQFIMDSDGSEEHRKRAE